MLNVAHLADGGITVLKTIRTSPEGSLIWAYFPSFAINWPEPPALRTIWPPFPILSSMLWINVPVGIFRRGRALPGLISAAGLATT